LLPGALAWTVMRALKAPALPRRDFPIGRVIRPFEGLEHSCAILSPRLSGARAPTIRVSGDR
jgi:hypothetical protein